MIDFNHKIDFKTCNQLELLALEKVLNIELTFGFVCVCLCGTTAMFMNRNTFELH